MKKLVIGIPKGSLEEQTIRLFEKAGIRIMNGSRSYYPASSDPEIKIMIARPQDIPLYVEKGVMDCGITGRDWVIERSAKVEEFAEMEYAKSGIGTVKWVLAAPKGNGINSVKDLEGKKISTELMETTKKYLMDNGVNAEVEFSFGATEVKCPWLADAIVELTETGRSLRENNLKIIDEVLESKTVLIANSSALKSKWKREKMDSVKDMLLEALTNK